MRDAVKRTLRRLYGLSVLDDEADRLLRTAGAVNLAVRPAFSCYVGGSDGYTEVCMHEIAKVMAGTLGAITETARSLFLSLDDLLVKEVKDSGACLTGGGALIDGMREKLQTEIGIRVVRAPDPLRSVIDGAQSMLPVIAAMKHWQN